MKKTIRNIVIFGIVTLGSGFFGHAINILTRPADPMQSLGVLVWLVSPLAVNLLLRSLGKDGWKDFGIHPHLQENWHWYLVALSIVPAIALVIMVLGNWIGVATVPGLNAQAAQVFLTLFITAFAGNAVKNIFEEFAWRGYLTPILARTQATPILSAIITSTIWAGWHIPYYLYFLDPAVMHKQTSFSAPTLILLSFVMLPFQALTYNELRLLSKSVWPTWLLHNMANAVEFALIAGGLVVITKNIGSTLLIPLSILMGLIGWGLYLHRTRSTQKTHPDGQAIPSS